MWQKYNIQQVSDNWVPLKHLFQVAEFAYPKPMYLYPHILPEKSHWALSWKYKLSIHNPYGVILLAGRSSSTQRHKRPNENPSSAEERLLVHLFRDYDTDARGVTEANETVTVIIQFLLLRIQGLVSHSPLKAFVIKPYTLHECFR